MRVWRWIYVGALALCLVVGLGVSNPLSQLNANAVALRLVGDILIQSAAGADDRDDLRDAKIAPRLKVDPSWPKPLPNNWVIGQIGGIAVDSRDHVWVLQRPRSVPERYLGAMLTPPRSTCCFAA